MNNNLQAIVSLDTGERTEHIYIYEGDDVELLADYFCERHDIRQEGKKYIIQEILNTLNNTQAKHQQTPSMTSFNSQAMIQKLYRNKTCSKTENDIYDYLHKEAWNQEQRKQQAIDDHLQEQAKSIREKPEINEKSKQLALQRSKSQQQIFEKLYKKQDKKIEKRKKLLQPQNQIYSPRLGLNRFQQNDEFYNRMKKAQAKSQQRLEEMRIQSNSPIDRKTGQQYFKPKINKNQIFQKVSKKRDQEDLETAYLIQQRLLSLKHSQKRIFDKNQQKIHYNNVKLIQSIFNQLDSDKDGQISTQFINLNINHNYLEKIAPVLCHMDEQHLILDIDSFQQLVNSFGIHLY